MIELVSRDDIAVAALTLSSNGQESFMNNVVEDIADTVILCVAAGVPASDIQIIKGNGIHIEFKETKK